MKERLRIEALQAGYRDVAVIRDISLRVHPGKITVLIGPNGAGKTTILRAAAGQLQPQGGVIFLEGQPLTELPLTEQAKRRAAMMTERPSAERMTCREVISLGRTPHTGRLGRLSERDLELVRQAMERVGVTELADRDLQELSDGQRQRVLLARAIVQEPRVLLLDEPTSYLDIRHKLAFLRILRELADQQQIGMLLSLHELELAHQIADEIVCVRADGTIAESGAPQDMMREEILGPLYEVEEGAMQELYTSFLQSLCRGKDA